MDRGAISLSQQGVALHRFGEFDMISMKHAVALGALVTSVAAFAATINGTAGGDILHGTQTGDTIRGYAGNDVLFGNGGNDVIYGELGNDHIYGGPGVNWMSGGAGVDRFFIQEASQTTISDVELLEDVTIPCAASWGNGQDLTELFRDPNTADPQYNMNFHGKNGQVILFPSASFSLSGNVNVALEFANRASEIMVSPC